VRPLLFDFKQLNVQQVKQLMSVKAGDTQLYMSVLVSILKKYQMRAQRPSFDDLKRELDVRILNERADVRMDHARAGSRSVATAARATQPASRAHPVCCCRALRPVLLTCCRDFLSSSHHIKPVMQDYKPLSQLITQGMVRWLHAEHSVHQAIGSTVWLTRAQGRC
jgi:hypothetical protein